MRIQFILRHPGALRMFDSTIRALASSGHEIRIVFNLKGSRVGHDLTRLLLADHPTIQHELAPLAVGSRAKVIALFSAAIDWMRYQDPRYEAAPKLVERANIRIQKSVPGVKVFLAMLKYTLGWRRAVRFLEGMLRAMPPDQGIVKFLSVRPSDILVVSPLVDFGSEQVEFMLAAKSLGRRTALLVHSWDNLTNKGLIRIIPEMVLVWNEAQKIEAVDMHGVPAKRVVVTGAQCYDLWYEMQPSESRKDFCQRVALDPDIPYVLFTGSSAFIGSDLEPTLVKELLLSLKAAARDCEKTLQILVRPHPQNFSPWEALNDGDGVAVHPRCGALPVETSARKEYFDSLYYAAAVVGINTSAMIEASILSRPVLSVLDQRFRDTQEGTLHFHHLLEGGHLLTSENVTELADKLYQAARGELKYQTGNLHFLNSFIRPYGQSQPSTPKVIDALLELASQPEPRETRTSSYELPAKISLKILMRLAMLTKAKKANNRKCAKSAKESSKKKSEGLSDLQLARQSWKDINGDSQYFSDTIKEMESKLVKRLRKRCSGRRVIIGPWLTEVGYEVLYWAPFVRWLVDARIFDPMQAVLVTRGGAEVWYAGLYKDSVDIFSLFGSKEFKQRNDERILETGTQKHIKVSLFDQDIIRRVQEMIGEECEIIHPSEMYRYLQPLFSGGDGGRAPMELGRRVLHHKLLTPPFIPDLDARLPERFVAVKFYFRSSFAHSPENRAYVDVLLHEIAAHHEIVLLNTRMEFDEHTECEADLRDRIHRIDDLLTPENNLAVQSAVIARAQAFFGTYGGLSYVPLVYGVPSFAFKSSNDMLNWTHLHFANEFALKHDVPFHLFQTGNLSSIRDLVKFT